MERKSHLLSMIFLNKKINIRENFKIADSPSRVYYNHYSNSKMSLIVINYIFITENPWISIRLGNVCLPKASFP